MQRISRLYEKTQAAEFGFTLSDFCELVTRIAPRSLRENCTPADQVRFIEDLHIDELVLAQACARGNEAAWQKFVSLYREKLYAAASAIAQDNCAGRELADSLYADLFGTRVRQNGQRSSKLESYLGRGSLEGWLRTVLAQEYVNRFRRDRKLVAFDEAIGSDIEVDSRHGLKSDNKLLADSTDAALAALSSEERFLLAAYYLDGRTLGEIGRMLNLHESTVSRRLNRTTQNVRKRVVARLRSAGLSKRDAEEMLKSDVRELRVDVRDRLAQGRQA